MSSSEAASFVALALVVGFLAWKGGFGLGRHQFSGQDIVDSRNCIVSGNSIGKCS